MLRSQLLQASCLRNVTNRALCREKKFRASKRGPAVKWSKAAALDWPLGMLNLGDGLGFRV